MSTEDAKVYRERALKDKSAILELRQNPAFNGYFMRRVNEKIEKHSTEMKHGKTIEEREVARQSVLFYEEIQRWLSDAEIMSCERVSSGQ